MGGGRVTLLFPGPGDIYIGHWKFAIFEVLVAAMIWLAVLVPNPEYPTTPVALLITAAIVVVFVHGVDAVATWFLARKAVYPAGE